VGNVHHPSKTFSCALALMLKKTRYRHKQWNSTLLSKMNTSRMCENAKGISFLSVPFVHSMRLLKDMLMAKRWRDFKFCRINSKLVRKLSWPESSQNCIHTSRDYTQCMFEGEGGEKETKES